MDDPDWLAQQFEQHRSHLRGVAFRMLGSHAEAEDAVQEAWLRLSRSGAGEIDNLAAWLTTVVARVSLDMLRSRSSRREDPNVEHRRDSLAFSDEGDPEHEAMVTDSLGPALLVVLGLLAPAERLAFVMHDMFAVPFEEIGSILGRSPNAAKQLASRARQRVRGSALNPAANVTRQREVVDAFLLASRNGNFDALVSILHPDVVLQADAAGVQMGAAAQLIGSAAVAGTFSGRALAAQPALVDGAAAIVWAPGGQPKAVWEVTISNDQIVHMYMIAAPETLDELDLVIPDN